MSRPWYDAYPKEVSHSLEYEQLRLTDFLVRTASKFPDYEAIEFIGKRISYRQLLDASYRFANAVIGLGIKPGDRISLMLPNCPQYVIAYYGALFAGAVIVQTSPLYSEQELRHQLKDSEASLIVCLDLVYPKVKAVLEDTDIANVIVTGIQDELPFPLNKLYPFVQRRKGAFVDIHESEPVIRWPRLLKHASDQPAQPEQEHNSGSVAVLQYTGGTTGMPKGVMLTHANIAANVKQCQAWMYHAQEGKETILTAVPLFHVYGMTVAMNYGVSIGASLVLVPKFDTGQLLKTIHKQRPTLFPGAPTMYIALLNHPKLKKYDLSSITSCISGSAPLPQEVQDRFEQVTGGKIVEGYGLSECSPVTHVNPIWGKRKIGSIGLPWPDTDCRIVDDEGNELPQGEAGELCIKGPQVMKGYWKQPEETEAAMLDGWVRTGDIAYMDEEGYFYIVDRKKDVIIAGGFKIYPREVEEVLYEHPDIVEAAVIGVPDEYRGETVKAFIVTKSGECIEEEELDRFCRERLAPYKVPRLYEFRPELPKTFVGKILRRMLAEEEKGKEA